MTALVQIGLPKCCHGAGGWLDSCLVEFCWASVKVAGRDKEYFEMRAITVRAG